MYRVNLAPAGVAPAGDRYRKHVGRRTTTRVWGDQTMPDLSSLWTVANETIVLYCGPTVNVINCWWSLPTTGRPRLSPLAWEEASLAIHGTAASKLSAALTQFPSSGAMAVWLALAQCASAAQHVARRQLSFFLPTFRSPAPSGASSRRLVCSTHPRREP